MVSNVFARSIGLGGSKAIKAKSITEGKGCFYKPDHAGDQDAAKVGMPNQRRGFQERDVSASRVDRPKTVRDNTPGGKK